MVLLARSKRTILAIAMLALLSTLNLSAQKEQAFHGTITDSRCVDPNGHAAISASNETAARCSISIQKGAKYVLLSPTNETLYQLDHQNTAREFAAKNVAVIGIVDKETRTIQVSDIIPALPPQVTRAKSVFIDCDGCIRGMVKAKLSALQELTDWKRFTVVPDRRSADLIVLLSANPYLGDYVTRDRRDTRPVYINVTFLNILDPRTGQSLWSDSRRWGSWRVTGATRDLIGEFRAQLEAGEGNVARLLLHYKQSHPETGPSSTYTLNVGK